MNLEILIIEPSEEVVESFYKELFEKLNYTCKFSRIPVFIDVNEYNYESYDIVVTDISYHRVGDNHGLYAVSEIKRNYPSKFLIANTKEYQSLNLNKLQEFYPEPDILLNKAKFYNENYKERVLEKIEKSFLINVYLEIDYEKSVLTDLIKNNLNAFISILKEITFTTHCIENDTAISKVIIAPLTHGYSSCEVFKCIFYSNSGLPCLNTVVKVTSSFSEIENEVKNYIKYVKWYLPYKWRPELIGHRLNNNLGAICYSFAFNNEKGFSTLTEYLDKAYLSKLHLTINKIFDPNYQQWYNEKNVIQYTNQESLTEYYYKKWFKGRGSTDEILEKAISYFTVEEKKHILYKDIEKNLFGNHKYINYNTCICHGDLNSNNILISENDELTFVDFQETGRGHVFDDFVTFEVSLRQNLNLGLEFIDNLTYEQSLNNEISLSKEEGIVDDFIDNIQQLRVNAFSIFNMEKRENYYYALALGCFRALRWDLKGWQNKQLVSTLISALKKLES